MLVVVGVVPWCPPLQTRRRSGIVTPQQRSASTALTCCCESTTRCGRPLTPMHQYLMCHLALPQWRALPVWAAAQLGGGGHGVSSRHTLMECCALDCAADRHIPAEVRAHREDVQAVRRCVCVDEGGSPLSGATSSAAAVAHRQNATQAAALSCTSLPLPLLHPAPCRGRPGAARLPAAVPSTPSMPGAGPHRQGHSMAGHTLSTSPGEARGGTC